MIGVGRATTESGRARPGRRSPARGRSGLVRFRHPTDTRSMARSPKIDTVDRIVERVRRVQAAGETVVMCHGCFDIVHPGHVRHLQHAARQGDHLLVTITGDAGVGKGDGRPLIPESLRAENLAALGCVDWVSINRDATAVDLLERLRPDVYVKGREYEHNQDPRFLAERSVVERHGGRIVFTSGEVVFSSTALIAAMEEMLEPVDRGLRQLVRTHDLGPATIERHLEAFADRRVLVVGEVIQDTYVACDRPNVASEGPMLSLRPMEYRHFDGGAAIVALHLAAMGARPILLTGLDRSVESRAVRGRLRAAGVEVHAIEIDQAIPEKQRFLVGTSKVVKLDLGEPIVLDAACQVRFLDRAESLARGCDAAIVTDYGLGLMSATQIGELTRRVRPHVGVLTGDVSGRRSSLLAMERMDLICPSEAELRAAVHDYDQGLGAVVAGVLPRRGGRAAIVTMGAEGVIAFAARDGDGAPPDWSSRLSTEHVPSLVGRVVDELGCGDALLAAATLTLVAGGSVVHASVLGSLAAAVQAERPGNAVVGAADLRRLARRLAGPRLRCHHEPGTVEPDAAASTGPLPIESLGPLAI